MTTRAKKTDITPAAAAPEETHGAGNGKIGLMLALLRRPQGARLEEMQAATGWQAHSVRGALSGSIRKKLGLALTSDKTEAGRVYRVAPEDRA
jgi:hypothetical protein